MFCDFNMQAALPSIYINNLYIAIRRYLFATLPKIPYILLIIYNCKMPFRSRLLPGCEKLKNPLSNLFFFNVTVIGLEHIIYKKTNPWFKED